MAVWSVKTASQVEQFAADFQGGKPAEIDHILRLDVFQRPPQPNQGALEDIVGIRPAANAGEVLDHVAGELAKTATGVFEQFRACLLIAGPETVQARLQKHRGRLGWRHQPILASGDSELRTGERHNNALL